MTILTLFAFLGTMAFLNEEEIETNKYTRSECIVSVEINTGPKTQNWSDSNKLMRKIVEISFISPPNGIGYVSAATYEENMTVYLQFIDKCENRLELAETVIEHLKNDDSLNFEYAIRPDIIEPSPKTIDIDGKWKDKSTTKLF